MIEPYFSISDMRRMLHQINYAPDGKRGYYCKSSQKKKRKHKKRIGKGR